jgi:hypothetical protein
VVQARVLHVPHGENDRPGDRLARAENPAEEEDLLLQCEDERELLDDAGRRQEDQRSGGKNIFRACQPFKAQKREEKFQLKQLKARQNINKGSKINVSLVPTRNYPNLKSFSNTKIFNEDVNKLSEKEAKSRFLVGPSTPTYRLATLEG